MTTASDVVLGYLRIQGDVIAGRADDVRVDAPDAVHRSRVATRRSRSALRTFAPLFRRAPVRALRDELAWHADHLGAPRDAEVLKERLLAALATLPADPAYGPIAERLAASLDETHARAHASLVESMATDRYTALPVEIYNYAKEPDSDFQVVAAGGILLLLILLLSMNATAIMIRNHYSRRRVS